MIDERSRLRQIARAKNMDLCGDSPYNPINGNDSVPKVSLIKAGRGTMSSPYSPATVNYMPNSSYSYGKGTLHETGAGRPVRSNLSVLTLETP